MVFFNMFAKELMDMLVNVMKEDVASNDPVMTSVGMNTAAASDVRRSSEQTAGQPAGVDFSVDYNSAMSKN
jgi:hypothetical protein